MKIMCNLMTVRATIRQINVSALNVQIKRSFQDFRK